MSAMHHRWYEMLVGQQQTPALPTGGDWVSWEMPGDWIYHVLKKAWDGIMPPTTETLLKLVSFAHDAEKNGAMIGTYRVQIAERAYDESTWAVKDGRALARLR